MSTISNTSVKVESAYSETRKSASASSNKRSDKTEKTSSSKAAEPASVKKEEKARPANETPASDDVTISHDEDDEKETGSSLNFKALKDNFQGEDKTEEDNGDVAAAREKQEEKTGLGERLWNLGQKIGENIGNIGKKIDREASSLGDKIGDALNIPIVARGTGGNDNVSVSQRDDGKLVVNINGQEKEYTEQQAERLIIDLGKGDNNLSADDSVTYGLNIRAGSGNNNIAAGKGDDTIQVGNGNNNISAGEGGDSVTAGRGDNTIDGGKGDDSITAGNGSNTISGGEGSDAIKAGHGDNTIDGGDENGGYYDRKYDDQGRVTEEKWIAYGDSITVGNGNNTVRGGAGNDTITAGNGNNTIDGGDETDPNQYDRVYEYDSSGNQKIIQQKRVEFGDVITAGNGDNDISGGAGNDAVTAGKGSNTINGGAGNDTIIAGGKNSFWENLWGANAVGDNSIDGGDGDDIIVAKGNGNHALEGGSGNDYIQGGFGNDAISGGHGDDVLYGLDGNDKIDGGTGNDYIDGGKGDDVLDGGTGKDIISGGLGNDTLTSQGISPGGGMIGSMLAALGGANPASSNEIGNDVLIDDMPIEGAKPGDITHVSSGTAVPKNIKANGDDEFRARVESDLTTLTAIPAGQKMLEELGNTGKSIKIEALPLEEKNGYAAPDDWSKCELNLDGTRNEGSGSTIKYNPSFTHASRTSADAAPPSVVLFHEMAHSYNQATGTMIPANLKTEATDSNGNAYYEYAREHQAVGLPINNALTDVDNSDIYNPPNPNNQNVPSPTHPDKSSSLENPEGISENALRVQLGLAERNSYR